MRKGRTSWVAQVPPGELQAIHERIDSVADESAKSIFDGLNLVRYTRERTFRNYVTERRRERRWQEQRTTDDGDQGSGFGVQESASSSPSLSPDRLVEELLSEVLGAVRQGRAPAYALPSMIMAVCKVRETDIREQAEKRAGELHAAKLAELRKKQGTAIDQVAAERGLTPEVLAEIRSKVLGL